MQLEFFTEQMANHAIAINNLTLDISAEQAPLETEPQTWVHPGSDQSPG